MQPGKNSEREICQTLSKLFNAEIVDVETLDDLLVNICDASLIASERFHGALAGLALGKNVEIVPQCEGDKLASLDPSTIGLQAQKIADGKKLLLV